MPPEPLLLPNKPPLPPSSTRVLPRIIAINLANLLDTTSNHAKLPPGDSTRNENEQRRNSRRSDRRRKSRKRAAEKFRVVVRIGGVRLKPNHEKKKERVVGERKKERNEEKRESSTGWVYRVGEGGGECTKG